VPVFLSPAWIAELADALASAPLPPHEPFPSFTVHQRVTGGPDGDRGYGVELSDEGIRVVPDPGGPGELTCITDYATAVALHRGELTAQEALESGRLEVRGRLEQVTAARRMLVALDDAARELRAATTYDPAP
jgi:hypothetical protein